MCEILQACQKLIFADWQEDPAQVFRYKNLQAKLEQNFVLRLPFNHHHKRDQKNRVVALVNPIFDVQSKVFSAT